MTISDPLSVPITTEVGLKKSRPTIRSNFVLRYLRLFGFQLTIKKRRSKYRELKVNDTQLLVHLKKLFITFSNGRPVDNTLKRPNNTDQNGQLSFGIVRSDR